MLKNDSEYEKTRQDVYSSLIERVSKERRDKIFIYTLSCGLGWKTIVFALVDELDRIWEGFQKKKGHECWSLLQMKEKFGVLRFYVSYPEGESEEAKKREDLSYDAITKASDATAKTCERCGSPGKLEGKGYVATVCEPCLIRWKERQVQGLWPTLFG